LVKAYGYIKGGLWMPKGGLGGLEGVNVKIEIY